MRGTQHLTRLARMLVLPLLLTGSIGSASAVADSKADWPNPVMDQENFGLLLFDLLEYESVGSERSVNWDVVGWRGGDVHRLWVKSEGSAVVSSDAKNETDIQLLYGRLVSAFFDFQIGPRLEQVWGAGTNASRLSVALGLQGLAIYRFEFEAAMFVGDSGHIAGRISANKDFLFTQKTIAQLRFETNGASKKSERFESGSGFNDLSLGLRLRHEFQREIAPYIGVNWTNFFGETADYRRLAGGSSTELSAAAGLRLWY